MLECDNKPCNLKILDSDTCGKIMLDVDNEWSDEKIVEKFGKCPGRTFHELSTIFCNVEFCEAEADHEVEAIIEVKPNVNEKGKIYLCGTCFIAYKIGRAAESQLWRD